MLFKGGEDQRYADYSMQKLVVSEDGACLTGELAGPIVNAERKAALLEEIASKEGIPLKQVLAVGDGANDLLMLKKAGLGLAFNAKPLVQLEVRPPFQITLFPLTERFAAAYRFRIWYFDANEYALKAPARLNTENLLDILYVLGFTKQEQEALLDDDDSP